jgi:hypothetical protein
LVIVIIIVYETNQELGRQTDPPSATQTADSASISIDKAQSEVRSYYRSHEFPAGWKVGDTDLIAPDRLEVSFQTGFRWTHFDLPLAERANHADFRHFPEPPTLHFLRVLPTQNGEEC